MTRTASQYPIIVATLLAAAYLVLMTPLGLADAAAVSALAVLQTAWFKTSSRAVGNSAVLVLLVWIGGQWIADQFAHRPGALPDGAAALIATASIAMTILSACMGLLSAQMAIHVQQLREEIDQLKAPGGTNAPPQSQSEQAPPAASLLSHLTTALVGVLAFMVTSYFASSSGVIDWENPLPIHLMLLIFVPALASMSAQYGRLGAIVFLRTLVGVLVAGILYALMN